MRLIVQMAVGAALALGLYFLAEALGADNNVAGGIGGGIGALGGSLAGRAYQRSGR